MTARPPRRRPPDNSPRRGSVPDASRHGACNESGDPIREREARMNARTDNDVTIPLLRAPKARDRTVAQLWEQYQVEKELAARLRDAPPLERRKLYSSVYDELFRRIPHHSQLTDKVSPQQRAARIAQQPVSYTHLRAHETPEHLVC